MEEFFENELVEKFEKMVENNEEFYFETEEFEEIIIYYLEIGDISYAEMATNYALKIHPNSIELKTKKILKITEAPDSIKKLYKEIANIVIVSSMPNY